MATTVLSVLGVPGGPQTFTPKSAAGQTTILLVQASETDLAQAIARQKTKAIGQVTETDTAQAITARKSIALGQASETDLAQAIATDKSITLGQAAESDTSQAIQSQKRMLIGAAFETDIAQAITQLIAGITYNLYGETFLYTAANWANVTFVFEVYVRAAVGTVYARLYDVTTTNQVAASDLSTASTSFIRLRTGTLGLTDGHEYRAQIGKTSGAGGQAEALGAHIMAIGA